MLHGNIASITTTSFSAGLGKCSRDYILILSQIASMVRKVGL
jgi:hypothetical protein